jgi:acyl-CoA synthetase (AMP-forming)/AMP-acid ligase II
MALSMPIFSVCRLVTRGDLVEEAEIGPHPHTSAFSQLFAEVCKTAYILHHDVSPPLSLRESGDFSRKTVALLAPSCKEFLVNAFALFRLGLGVLLVA